MRICVFGVCIISFLATFNPCVAADGLVKKSLDSFAPPGWVLSPYNTAVGKLADSDEKSPDGPGSSAITWDVKFAGEAFQGCQINPVSSNWIPGDAKSLTLRLNVSLPRYGMKLNFVDGWGRDKADGKPLDIDVKPDQIGQWTTLKIDIPKDWVRPVRLSGITVHNWSARGDNSLRILLAKGEVETDISGVDPKTGRYKLWEPNPAPVEGKKASPEPLTPLVSTSLTAKWEHNVFVAEQPSFTIGVQSWLDQKLTGNIAWKVIDDAGVEVVSGGQALAVQDSLSIPIDLKVPRFGWYRIDLTGGLSDGSSLSSSQPLVYLPKPVELSEADKDASPYGLNVLAARKPMVGTFKNAGIIWYRDYGFDYEWLLRAKGADKSYSGWPWYPPMVKMYDSFGVRVLACLKSGIKPPRANEANGLEPDATWKREMTSILTAFPTIHHYELDNEYDLSSHGAERIELDTDWKNYRAYHRVFGQLVSLMGGGQSVAVENGRAGIWPNRVKKCVESGDFSDIQVVNSHHYTGTEPPETNVINHNMGLYNAEEVLTFYDQLRASKRNAMADGKPRQHWLTEFGWDTRAGPIVTPLQQAVYLQRGYMLAMAAGCEKAFWFFDVDSAKAEHFFDGCGLVRDDQLPNLSLAAMAGLTQILPRPRFVGMISAGDDTRGYLFKNDDKLVATLFTVDKASGPVVDFESAAVFDYLANPVSNSKVTLTPAPVFAVGVSEKSAWFRQSAYSLKSPVLVTATSGDTVTAELQVQNDRQTAIDATAKLELHSGWSAVDKVASIHVPAGQKATIPITFRVDPKETIGEKTLFIAISESQPLLRIPLRVRTQEPIGMTVRGLRKGPGEDAVTLRLVNYSTRPMDGTLSFELPKNWSTPQPKIDVTGLKPMEPREQSVPIHWDVDWKPEEKAIVHYTSSDGRSTEQPLIPTRLSIHRAPALTMDGDLSDWPVSTRLPDWVLGSTAGRADADLYAAWSDKGLYVAAKVRGSKASSPDPKTFWDGDALEVFVDTRNQKDGRKFEIGDHQFWIVPQVDRHRAYLGQWKRLAEIPQTLYDLPTASFAGREGDGYVIEILIPASVMKGFDPKPGSSLGLNLNLKVIGQKRVREVYWSLPKSEGVTDQPGKWGSVLLAD